MPDSRPLISRCVFPCCAAALVLLAAGCMAPHGMAPLPLPMARDTVFGELSGGYGATSERSVVRTELGANGQLDDWVALELRGQYLHVEEQGGIDESGGQASRAIDAFQPYLRPTFFAGPVTFALPVSGFAMGAGGGGVAAGLIGVSAGFGGTTWNVFSGVQWQGSEFVSSNSSTSRAREICFGGRYALLGDLWRISIDPQVVVSSHRYESHSGGNDDHGPTSSFRSDRQFVMGLMQLSAAIGDLRQRRPSAGTAPEPGRPRASRGDPEFPAPAPPPTACDAFCDAQARLRCGLETSKCRDACERRALPLPCRATGDALLRCEASGLTCSGPTLVFPPCATLRSSLEACLATHSPPPPDTRPCAPGDVCDGGPSPIRAAPRRGETKSLGEVPQ